MVVPIVRCEHGKPPGVPVPKGASVPLRYFAHPDAVVFPDLCACAEGDAARRSAIWQMPRVPEHLLMWVLLLPGKVMLPRKTDACQLVVRQGVIPSA